MNKALLIAPLVVVLLIFLWVDWLREGLAELLEEMEEAFRQLEDDIRKAARRLGG